MPQTLADRGGSFQKERHLHRLLRVCRTIGGNIQLRFFQPGDIFVPLGMQGHKKVKSFFIDQKIPRKKRPFIPILINGNDDIIWIYGERISDSFRVDATTKKVLFIEGKVI